MKQAEISRIRLQDFLKSFYKTKVHFGHWFWMRMTLPLGSKPGRIHYRLHSCRQTKFLEKTTVRFTRFVIYNAYNCIALNIKQILPYWVYSDCAITRYSTSYFELITITKRLSVLYLCPISYVDGG